jgi:NADH-quinone oxidoreductase subunit J
LGSELLFYALAAVSVLASALVIGQRSPIYSVMLLIASFLALAGLYVLLEAPFVAVIQIVIYAGAILVLFLFVVMLLNAPKEGPPHMAKTVTGPRRAGTVLAAALVIELAWALWKASILREPGEAVGPEGVAALASVREIGRVLFSNYVLAFEVTSLLILVAMVGAVVLAKRHVS